MSNFSLPKQSVFWVSALGTLLFVGSAQAGTSIIATGGLQAFSMDDTVMTAKATQLTSTFTAGAVDLVQSLGKGGLSLGVRAHYVMASASATNASGTATYTSAYTQIPVAGTVGFLLGGRGMLGVRLYGGGGWFLKNELVLTGMGTSTGTYSGTGPFAMGGAQILIAPWKGALSFVLEGGYIYGFSSVMLQTPLVTSDLDGNPSGYFAMAGIKFTFGRD